MPAYTFRLRRSPARQARLLTSFEKRHMEIPIYFHVSKFKIVRRVRQGLYFYRQCQISIDASRAGWSANA